MIDQALLLWQFLRAQPPAQYLLLADWHLLAVLAVLGVLSAFGLHFLIGYLFRFYRRKDRHARWIAWPTLPVLLASVLLLLASYLLGVRSAELVRVNLNATMLEQLGRTLLEPAFGLAPLNGVPVDDVPKAAIQAALRSASELDYRSALQQHLVAPATLAPGADGTGGARGPDVLVQMGLRWVTEPHAGWAPPPAGKAGSGEGGEGAAPEREGAFFLPEFLLGLLDELPDDTALPRIDWEHVAGTRYVENVLRPLVEEYLTYLAVALAVVVLLLDVLYLLVMARLKRIGRAKPAARSAAAKGDAAASSASASSVPALRSESAPAVPDAASSAPVSGDPAPDAAQAKS